MSVICSPASSSPEAYSRPASWLDLVSLLSTPLELRQVWYSSSPWSATPERILRSKTYGNSFIPQVTCHSCRAAGGVAGVVAFGV